MQTLAGEPLLPNKVCVFLEVAGTAQYLPAYAGNLDFMISAALRVADQLANSKVREQ